MSNVGYATLTVIPSAQGFAPALAGQTNPAVAKAGKAGGKKFGGALIGGLKGPMLALGGVFAATKIVGFFGGTIKEASGLGESLNALRVTYGDNADAVANLGTQSAKALGLSNLDFNNLAVRFSAFTKTIAGEGGNVVGTLDDLTGRASDFASVMNLEVSEAAQLFQSGLAGESEPLRKFGIDMSAASVAAYAYANGIAEQGSTLTEAQKVQARYGSLMEQTAQTQGDFANTSDQLANKQRILSSRWSDAKAKIGGLLLPAMSGFVGLLNDRVMPAVESGIDFFSRLFSGMGDGGGIFETLKGHFSGLVETVQGAFAGIDSSGAIEGFKSLLSSIGEIFTTHIIPAALSIGEQLTPAIQLFGETVGVVMENAGPILSTIGELLKKIFAVAFPIIIAIVKSIVANVIGAFTGLMNMIQGVVRLVAAIFRGDWGAAWDAVKQIVKGAITFVWNFIQLGIIGKAVGLVKSGVTTIKTFFKTGFDGIKTGVKVSIEGVVALVKGLPGKALSALGNIGTKLLSAGRDLIGGFIRGITQRASGIVTTIRNTITDKIPSFVKKALGIASPSRVFMALGRYTAEGMAVGIAQGAPDVAKAAEGLVPPTPSVEAPTVAPGGLYGATGRGGDSFTFGDLVLDVEDLRELREIEDFFNMLRRRARQMGATV